jgi:hypothetical protein
MTENTIMKSLKILFLVLSAGLLLAGCSKDVYVQGTEMTYFDYDVRNSQWRAGDGYYTVTLDVPAITNHVVRNGNVQVSRCYLGETENDDVWTPLPVVRVNTAPGADGGEYYFSTYTDYEWSARTVNIFVTTSDLYMEDTPGDMSFRVIITQ